MRILLLEGQVDGFLGNQRRRIADFRILGHFKSPIDAILVTLDVPPAELQTLNAVQGEGS